MKMNKTRFFVHIPKYLDILLLSFQIKWDFHYITHPRFFSALFPLPKLLHTFTNLNALAT